MCRVNHTWRDETYLCQQIHDSISWIERLTAHTPADKAEQIRYTVYQYENTRISYHNSCSVEKITDDLTLPENTA